METLRNDLLRTAEFRRELNTCILRITKVTRFYPPVHPKGYAHHLSHPLTLPPTCCPGCRLQDVTAFLGAFAMVLIEGRLISWLPAPDGNLQVLVWRHPIASCCKLFHAPGGGPATQTLAPAQSSTRRSPRLLASPGVGRALARHHSKGQRLFGANFHADMLEDGFCHVGSPAFHDHDRGAAPLWHLALSQMAPPSCGPYFACATSGLPSPVPSLTKARSPNTPCARLFSSFKQWLASTSSICLALHELGS